MNQDINIGVNDVRKDAKEFIWTTGNVFFLVAMGFLIWFGINANNWFGARIEQFTIIIYIVLLLTFIIMAILNKTDTISFMTETKWGNRWNPKSLLTQSFFMMCGFVFTYLVLLIALWTGNIEIRSIVRSQAFGFLTFFFVVAFVEEVVFRGILVNMLKDGTKNPLLIYGISQGAFAVFHGAVYGWNIQTIGFAFGVGVVWLYIAQKYGIGFTIGSHWIYNSFLQGIFSGGITGTLSGDRVVGWIQNVQWSLQSTG